MKVRKLGQWQPSRYDERTIAAEILDVVKERTNGKAQLPRTGSGVRDPQFHQNPARIVFEWHQDNFGDNTPTIVWSNIHPTEIRYKRGKQRIPVQPGEIVWFDNQAVEHRAPKAAQGSDRWFIRLCTDNNPE